MHAHSCFAVAALLLLATAFGASSAQAQDRQGAADRDGGAPAVQQVNQQADTAATQANTTVVGQKTERKNEAQAESPQNASEQRKKQNEKEASKTANEVGHATTTAANVIGREVADVTTATDKPGRYNPFAIEYDPLGLFVGGRVSFNLEWVPVTHHAIVVSPHFVHTSADVSTTPSTTVSEAFTGFGGEIGYRYYTGHRGPNGVFIGPSLLLGFYNAGLNDGNQPFTDVGVAVDAGVQWVFWDHLVVGGGVGVEYLQVGHDFHDLPTGPSTIASSGVKPRLLLEAGYGF